ncbi:putative d-arabinono- -lactone oxidase protein [Phaeoacremonium minimum UCRPA7]|uniref:D-arabinono-1,4-lactone oxidase n=1 Tax=Phaeoacremonium minimum (strain UCR-PA7) TaxID=1286976 RepID=R8BUW1_PHAM7|nr:putative d-arabinono- -lactone oxidase protein [Phaeoacremonium minimum UCRPA7]EOO03079.1 putative d-arabinono- -lactone oxidase protein [Phaeoacremonium minimum UCRPA7]
MELSYVDARVVREIDAAAADGVAFRAKTNHVHSTWARTFSSRPELYIQPQSIEEVEKAINLARRCRRRITTVGCGHSPSELTCTSSWLINLDNFNRILSVDTQTGITVMQSGIRLYQLSEHLDRLGLAMKNLGSINEQSIAGVISTGTHGSSLLHGLVSESILSLKITLADGKTRSCSKTENEDLFRAALLSLGALGIITEVTFKAVPAYSLKWTQVIDADTKMFNTWSNSLWPQGEFVRVWWFPYMRKSVVWAANKTDEPHRDPPTSYYDGSLGYYVYHNLLYLAHYAPRILPWVEWFVFGMQYGFANGSTVSGIQPSRKALLMNCLYSQYVNEWAIPLRSGPEALRRLSSWLNDLKPGDRDYVAHGIPFSNKGLYVHSPVEVRVSDTSRTDNSRPFLDPTCPDEPTLYLNAIMYRPYDMDPPCRDRYYEGFEWLMRDLGGKPHWAKNFDANTGEIEALYGDDLTRWRQVRDKSDPEGMFVGSWHRRFVLGGAPLPLEEVEVERETRPRKGTLYYGAETELLEKRRR